jgi:uncharacterized RDD family membrane protein YckC
MPSPDPAAARPVAAPAALGWRLLAMMYDAVPMLPIALLVSALVLVANGLQPVVAPAGRAALALGLWLAAGLYFVLSWRRGGQTMGMRPWRLRVVAATGQPATSAALWARYAVATVSLGLAGLGFLWSLVDPERRAWHDLASGTRLVRDAPAN